MLNKEGLESLIVDCWWGFLIECLRLFFFVFGNVGEGGYIVWFSGWVMLCNYEWVVCELGRYSFDFRIDGG